MESKLLKIQLNQGSRNNIEQLIWYIPENIEFPKSEMDQKGYYWDSVFYEINDDAKYVYIVMKSSDFSKTMVDETGLLVSPFRTVYERFREECWAPEHYLDIEPMFYFNSSLVLTN